MTAVAAVDAPVRSRGRPTKFTDTIRTRLIANIRSGYHYETACKLAGVSYATFREWMVAGEQGDPVYSEFAEEVHATEAQVEANHVERIAQASAMDWHASGWLLTRRFPDRWADQSRRTVTVEGTVTHTHVHTLAPPDPAQLAGLLGYEVEGTYRELDSGTEPEV